MTDTSLSAADAQGGTRERAIRIGLGVLAALSLSTGVFMVVDPAGFVDTIGPFGAVNDHYVRDLSTWTLAYGAALVVAVGNAAWRVPVLAFGIAQGALHLVNHFVDIGDAEPGWVGVFDAVALAATLGVTCWLLVAARAQAAAGAVR